MRLAFTLILTLMTSVSLTASQKAMEKCPECPKTAGSLKLVYQELEPESLFCGYEDPEDPESQTYCIYNLKGDIVDNGGGDDLCELTAEVSKEACSIKPGPVQQE